MPRGGKATVYKPEFKQTAIELAISSNKTIAEIAIELSLHPKTLHNWVYSYKKSNNLTPVIDKEPSLSDELKRLKKENARLKMECDILKKATAPICITPQSKASRRAYCENSHTLTKETL